MTTSPTGSPASQPKSPSTSEPAIGPVASRGGRAPVGGLWSSAAPGDVVASDVIDTRDPAEVVRDAVLAVPGVAGLHGGAFGTVATYLPGRRVSGVAMRADGSVEVSIVAVVSRGLATDLQALAARVRQTTAELVPAAVNVTIADLASSS